MAQQSKRNKASFSGLLSNYRYLCKKSMVLCAMESARARKKYQQKITIGNMKRKTGDNHNEPPDTNTLVKKTKSSDADQEYKSTLDSEITRTDKSKQKLSESESKASDHHSFVTALRDCWEVDSGFSSETSPPASGRSSPCLSSCSTTVVALDCEMVGTGPGGRCSELARCSILDYHGNILYDKYVQPCQPVTDYRTRWSGIRRHHLRNAISFTQAREEVRSVIGLHSCLKYNRNRTAISNSKGGAIFLNMGGESEGHCLPHPQCHHSGPMSQAPNLQ